DLIAIAKDRLLLDTQAVDVSPVAGVQVLNDDGVLPRLQLGMATRHHRMKDLVIARAGPAKDEREVVDDDVVRKGRRANLYQVKFHFQVPSVGRSRLFRRTKSNTRAETLFSQKHWAGVGKRVYFSEKESEQV